MRSIRKTHFICALQLLFLGVTPLSHADDLSLSTRLITLEQQVRDLQTQLKNQEVNAPLMNSESVPTPTALSDSDTRIFSYGEINYNRPINIPSAAQADVRRLVLGYQHRFDPKTKALVEIEYEHAIASASDPGEAEVEQAFIEHAFTPTYQIKAGLFLIPMGLLNEHHEPTSYFGVERNFVETAIIPTTWREGGVNLIASLDNGWTVQGGITSSFDLGKWDPASTEGQESPLGAVHQELALAKAKDNALFAAADWRGLPGLQIGLSAFGGPAGQDNPLLTDSHILLWEAHARWTPNAWDLSALYARGTITHTQAFNTSVIGNISLIPQLFDGYYLQAGYRLWSNDQYSVSPFFRYETFNTAASYAFIGNGVTPTALPDTHVAVVGATIGIGQNVVVKFDGQHFAPDKLKNRFDLGVGWSF
jgi:hypothetical protein